MIQALIFDFDGVILETEMPDFKAWSKVFEGYGVELPLSLWGEIIGQQMAHAGFDPYTYLEQRSGLKIDRQQVGKMHETAYMDAVLKLPVMPGVRKTIKEATDKQLKLGVASSSHRNWVQGHLERLGLYDAFADIKTADDVSRTKPSPELYLKSLEALQVTSNEAIVIEDSPNGLRAAKAAGIFVVAVPNELTSQLDLGAADLRIGSLEDIELTELISLVESQNE